MHNNGSKEETIPSVVIDTVKQKDSQDVPFIQPLLNVLINPKSKMEEITLMDAKAQAQISKSLTNPELKNHKGWNHFWKGTMADLKNKKLIPVKTLFFFKAATLFVLYPFLTLHMKALGLDAAETGINSAFIPVVAILASPFAGVIADKIGNFKILLSSLTLINAGTSLLLLLVPVARETIDLPSDLTFSLNCHSQNNQSFIGSFILEMVGENTCTVGLSSAPWENLVSVVQCGSLCPVTPVSVNNSHPTFTSLPLVHNNTYVIPGKKATFTPFSNERPDLVCSGQENNSCFLAFSNLDYLTNSITTVDTTISQLESQRVSEFDNVTKLSFAIKKNWKFANHDFNQMPNCMGSNSRHHGVNHCTDECLVSFPRNLFCSNRNEIIIYDVSLTFWLYTIFRVILGLGSAMTWIMFEGAVLAILKETGGDYGLQRVSASIASIFVSPISGALIYYYQDFRPAFYLYAILQVVSAVFTLWIDLTFKKPTEKILGHLKNVMSQIEIIIFFFAMLLSGCVWGYLESFLFWFLKNLGGSEILMGLTISVGGLAGLPFLISSRVIIKKMGHVNVLCLGLLFYFIRLVGYSIIEDPWLCLPFEAMEAITTYLAITAAATYASALSTEQTIASIQGVMGALYFGFGRGFGSLIGGFLIKWYGERVTFQLFGVAALVCGVLYFILNSIYIRNIEANRLGERSSSGSGDARKLSSTTNQDGVTEREMSRDLNGGFIGPCDVNAFTDVPLDEEPSSTETSTPSTIKLTRPASFPQKSKIQVQITHSRPSET